MEDVCELKSGHIRTDQDERNIYVYNVYDI